MIWTSGAASDFLSINSEGATFDMALGSALELLRHFPEQGTRVPRSQRLRRLLVGKFRQWGLFYSLVGQRIVIVALVDLRRSPDGIEELLSSREAL